MNGIYPGDVVTAIDGRKIKDLMSFWASTREAAESNRATVQPAKDQGDVLTRVTPTIRGVRRLTRAEERAPYEL